MPILVVCWKKLPKLFHLLAVCLILFQIALSMALVFKYEFRVGVIAIENIRFAMFDRYLSSPFTKFMPIFLGCYLSIFFRKILIWRQTKKVEDRIDQMIAYLDSSDGCKKPKSHFWVVWGLAFISLGSFMTYILMALTANQHPYSWSTTANAIYYGFNRVPYFISLSAILVVIFTKNLRLIEYLLGWVGWRVLARLTFGAFLAYPLVIFLLYANTEQPFFLRYPSIIWSLFHHVTVSYLFSFVFFLVIESPFNNIRKTIVNKLRRFTNPGLIYVPLTDDVILKEKENLVFPEKHGKIKKDFN